MEIRVPRSFPDGLSYTFTPFDTTQIRGFPVGPYLTGIAFDFFLLVLLMSLETSDHVFYVKSCGEISFYLSTCNSYLG